MTKCVVFLVATEQRATTREKVGPAREARFRRGGSRTTSGARCSSTAGGRGTGRGAGAGRSSARRSCATSALTLRDDESCALGSVAVARESVRSVANVARVVLQRA
jgi:hypothetical protein